MSGLLWGALGILGGFGLAAVGDMVSEEVRDRLDHLPQAILRLAAWRLAPEQRVTVYEDEWLPELTYILQGDEARPVTRLVHGVRYALGIVVSVHRIEPYLDRPAPEAALVSYLASMPAERAWRNVQSIRWLDSTIETAEGARSYVRVRAGIAHMDFLPGSSRRRARFKLEREMVQRQLAGLYTRRAMSEINIGCTLKAALRVLEGPYPRGDMTRIQSRGPGRRRA